MNITKTKIKAALTFILAQAKEMQGFHTGGPYEQTYNSLLKEAEEVVKHLKQQYK